MGVSISDTRTVDGFVGFTRLIAEMLQPAMVPTFTADNWVYPITQLEEIHAGYFSANQGPDGSPWPELSPITILRKGSSEILVDQRLLIDSLTITGSAEGIREMDGQCLTFGTRRAWAWTHQEGNGRIPQRMHTGLNNENVQQIVDSVADEIVRQMFGV